MGAEVRVGAGRELLRFERYPDVKDPSVAFDGRCWHLFGTGCGRDTGLEILHATAPRLTGPWREEAPPVLVGVDHLEHRAAPGVIAEGEHLHLFLQHDFASLGGDIEHLVSEDGGSTFAAREPALRSVSGTAEAGIYDPDPAEVDGARYLTYAAMSVVGQPDLYLARSTSGSWDGPWERLGPILTHEQVEGHNRVGDADYEWGLEGPQLLGLPDGRCLLTAVAFMAEHPIGHRQRVLLALADRPEGPYEVLGGIVPPAGGRGENGHGVAVVHDGEVELVYQEREGPEARWHYRQATLESPAWAVAGERPRGAVRTA